MFTDDKKIVEQSIDFLNSTFEKLKRTPRHAYPVSSLPYPKKVVRKAMKDHIIRFSEENTDKSFNKSLELRVLKGLYLMLADFMDDEDARLVNNVWDMYAAGTGNLEEEINTIGQWHSAFKTTKEKKRYEKAVAEAEVEREEMSTEINALTPSLRNVNVLQFV